MITSLQNTRIKELIKLVKQKNIIVLDSLNLIEEAKKLHFEFLEIIKNRECTLQGFDNAIVVSDHIFEKFCSVIKSKGIVAIVKNKQKEFALPSGNYLVLENLQDCGNIGTLIRSAVASNFCDIYLVNCANVSNAKVLRSTVGTFFKANLYEVGDEFYGRLPSFAKNLYYADMNGKNLFDIVEQNSYGIVVGNEGQGISQAMRAALSCSIKIPMQNNVESLNAAVCGSTIMLYLSNLGGKNVRT